MSVICIYLISDIECLCSGIDDELMVGRYDTGIVDDSQDTCEYQKQPVDLKSLDIPL